MQTMSDLDVDLSLTSDDSEVCYSDETKEATGYVEYSDVCPCNFPNPAPLCEDHYQLVLRFLKAYGPVDWSCPMCNVGVDVVAVYRKNR